MKDWTIFAMMAALFLSANPITFAQDDSSPAPVSADEFAGEQQSQTEEETMNEGMLAIVLAQKLGLTAQLPLNPSPITAINALVTVGIRPRDGWNQDSVVTLGTMAYLLAQVMELNVTDMDDDQAVLEACIAAGVDFSSIGNALISAGVLSTTEIRTALTGVQMNDPLHRLPPGMPSDLWTSPNNYNPLRPGRLPAVTPN